MRRRIFITEDGTPSIKVESLDESYHSKHGALTESAHIFINAGLKHFKHNEISILEVGFGTGLNAYLTLNEKEDSSVILYHTIEKYPLDRNEWREYISKFDNSIDPGIFNALHEAPWEIEKQLTPGFKLKKIKCDLRDFHSANTYNIIYFDAFAPEVQPALWSESVFQNMYRLLSKDGILVTYSVKGIIRTRLQKCGFRTVKLPGPPGKRQILRAVK